MLNEAYIDLNILRQNALKIKKALPSGVKFNAVVKDDAYGHGAVEVANAVYTIVDGFSVALVEEGVKLRLAGVKKDILVLIPPLKSQLKVAIENGLTLCVDSKERLKEVIDASLCANTVVKVHVKVNTGMNRLGASLKEVRAIFEMAKSVQTVKIEGIFSHLACPEHENITKSQVNKFLLAKSIAKSYNNKIVAHLSASGGFLKGYYFDMVRVGILLYGYYPFKNQNIKVKPIMKIYSPIIAKRHIKKGELLLYGDKPITENVNATIVRVGYGDGFLRKVNDDILNNRCMDTSAYKKIKKKGEYALVLEDASDLADKTNTISYEVLTNCAVRARKNYKR